MKYIRGLVGLSMVILIFSLLGLNCQGAKQRAIFEKHQAIYDTWWMHDGQGKTKMMDQYFGSDGTYRSSGAQDGTWVWTLDSVMKIETPHKSWILEFSLLDSERIEFRMNEEVYSFYPQREVEARRD